MKQPTPARRPTRILLHSHDSFGLGHLRRTLTLAGALAERNEGAGILVTSGSPCATQFPIPRGVDVIKLPSATKDADGRYVPRTMPGDLEALVRLRRSLLSEVVDNYRPDVFLVDHQPLGLAGELAGVLERARGHGARTVLGLRDVIDTPDVVAREWGRPEIRRALRSQYDRVCVYGAAEVFDPRTEYPIPPELRGRVEFVGYVVRPPSAAPLTARGQRKHVLVTLGGGEDGDDAVTRYLDCLKAQEVPWDSTIVLGPLMDPQLARVVKRAVEGMPRVRARSFYSDLPRLLKESDAVVAMAGYNTVAEILQSRVSSVLMPRVFPRKEQLLRTRALARLGLARMQVDPSPERLYRSIVDALESPPDWTKAPPLDGAERLCQLVDELIEARPQPVSTPV